MDPQLRSLVSSIADQADDFLEGVQSLDQARAAISEMVTMEANRLSPGERSEVIAAVMQILQEEDFFSGLPGGTQGQADDPGDSED